MLGQSRGGQRREHCTADKGGSGSEALIVSRKRVDARVEEGRPKTRHCTDSKSPEVWAPAHAEPRPSARDGPRELRLPVLVVNPGKDVVVAQRVSMDRANTGAQLPVVDDYVFHKTSSNADRAPPHMHRFPALPSLSFLPFTYCLWVAHF